jgi:hypothetical protein
MKYAIIFLSFYFLQFTTIYAQDNDSLIIENPVKLNSEKHNLAGTDQESFALWVSEANSDDVAKAWEKAMESGNKAKMESIGNKHEIVGVILKKIDKTNPMNVYTDINQGREGVNVYVAFQLGDSSWIDPNSNQDKTVKAENLLTAFGFKIYLEVLDDKLSVENSKLKGIEKEYNANLKNQTDERKSIQADSLSIFNIENEIRLKKNVYKGTTDILSMQQNYIAGTNFSSDVELKEANRLMKDIEKELKRTTKSIENAQSDIIDKQKDIKDSYLGIDQLKKQEEELMNKLTEQRSRVDRLEHEIYNIENNND